MLERCERGGCGGEITLPFQFSAVTCSRIRICRVGLYNVGVFGFALLQAEFLASVPFISNARLPPGSPACLLCPLCGTCPGIVSPEPSAFGPPSFLLSRQGRLLSPGKALPAPSPFSSEPSGTALGLLFLLFLLPNVLLSSCGCLPFSSLSPPALPTELSHLIRSRLYISLKNLPCFLYTSGGRELPVALAQGTAGDLIFLTIQLF